MTEKTPPQDHSLISEEDDGIRVDRWFKRHRSGTPHALIARWARSGDLRLDGQKADVSDRVATGQQITMPFPPSTPVEPRLRANRPLTPEEIAMAEAMVIHSDRSAIILNKLPGIATQGGTKTDFHIDGLLGALQSENSTRPKLVHRLDKDTSGALLIARTARAASWFAKCFENRSARKTYWALVVGVPSIDQGEINLALAKQPGSGGEKMHVHESGLPSRTRYRVIERAGNSCAWVELTPFTGRTHQLRVHMAAIGHPIVGDGKYGGKDAFLTGTISRKLHLHSRRISVDHPEGGTLDISAEPPEHFNASLDALGFDRILADIMAEEKPRPPAREIEKKQAKAHAKQVRKARRGERRGRAESASITRTKAPSRGAKPAAKGGKPSSRPTKAGSAKPTEGSRRSASRTTSKAGAKPATGATRRAPAPRSPKPGKRP
ncbi:MAG TPA: pseudouridine synthase [Sphingopyxis sp.]|nr:pseudouridine synthase [Sphingopyxis sp.]